MIKPHVCLRGLYWAAAAVFTITPMAAQQPPVVPQITCDATAEPLIFRSEGLSERVGEIVLTCAGPSTGTVSASLTLGLSHSLGNKLSGDFLQDTRVVAQTASGLQTLVSTGFLVSPTVVVFGSFSFIMPPSGQTSFVITGLRIAGNPSNNSPVTVRLGTSGQTSIGIRNNPVTVGVPQRGLLTSGTSTRIVCTSSLLPEEINFGTLVNGGVRFATTRVTEGFPSAFEPRTNPLAQGTRILIRYAGLPSQARLFLPDFIAGSTASDPTSAGDLGWPASAGSYSGSGGGMLLLARVPNADGNGFGDTPRNPPGIYLNGVSELFLRGGEGSVTYEVLDANSQAFESAQIPTFIALPRDSGQDGAVATAQVTFAPLSTIAQPHASAPIPRFRDVAPPLDCTLLRDCTAGYFPRLVVDAPALDFNVSASPGFYQKFIRVLNDNQGIMNWTTKIQYRNGAGWLKIFPEAGVNNASLNLSAFPEKLAPGLYEATLTIDAGPLAGTRVFAVRLTVVGDTPPPAGTAPQIRVVSSYLSEQATALVPGSLASIRGLRLLGQDVKVSFDGFAAQVVASGASGNEQKLDIVVPVSLATQQSAVILVTVNGVASLGQKINLTPAAPVIFPNGLLNQDGTPNSITSPEAPGRLFSVYATGLPAEGLGFISVKIHDREISQPQYAGLAPGLPGIQQVNFFIPEDLPSMQSEALVCGTSALANNTRVCSRPYTIQLKRNDE